MKTLEEKKQMQIEKFKSLEKSNYDNYHVGGGLGNGYVSQRHDNAKSDESKITLGEASKILKKFYENYDKEVLLSEMRLEWHHAGFYKNAMQKTYFVNASQMVYLLENYNVVAEKKAQIILERKNEILQKEEILKKYEYVKLSSCPQFGIGNTYMNGKYGEFEADYKYNLPTYWRGRVLSEEDYNNYNSI